MTASERKTRLVALLAELADVLLGDESAPATRHYDADHLPPGASSWRQVLDLHRAGRLSTLRVGKRIVVTSEAWDAHLATCANAPRPKREPDADPMARFPRRSAA